MAGTRSSSRLASQQKSSPTQPKESPSVAAGSKRKSEAGSSPSAKRGRKASGKKEQKTIEETMDVDQPDQVEDNAVKNGNRPELKGKEETQESRHIEETEPHGQAQDTKASEDIESKVSEQGDSKQRLALNGDKAEVKADDKANDKAAEKLVHNPSKMDDTGKVEPTKETKKEITKESATEPAKETANEPTKEQDDEPKPEPRQNDKSHAQDENTTESHARDSQMPSSILEKGVIYFLFRGRVGIDNPSEVNDIARSYIVLRPIPHGAKIGEDAFGDGKGKCRLLALPKKVLPLSGKDKFMVFVEKSNTTFKELREGFMSASDYTTQTVGTRHTPPVTPIAEGVYAMTTTGRESHLAYMITIPQELGEVQKDIGIREQGSFITSAKNPQYAGPANTNLPEGPGFPQEYLDEFRSLRWAPLQPKFLDYENTQFLLIGESGGIENATAQQPADQKADKDDPKEELEKLEGEDEIRIGHMKGDDAIFADLGINKKEYPQVPSTWND